MRDKRPVDELSIEELERILAIKKREARQAQLQRMKRSGRVVPTENGPHTADVQRTVEQLIQPASPPRPSSPETHPDNAFDSGRTADLVADGATSPHFEDDAGSADEYIVNEADQDRAWKRFVNAALLLVEVAAVVGLVVIGINLFNAIGELEAESRSAQEMLNATRQASLPTIAPTPTLRLTDFVLPTGHKVTADGAQFNFDELPDDIPDHLLTAIQNEVYAPDIQRPPPTSETALNVTIPKLGLDEAIVQGTDWDALRQGVGQVLNGANPADSGGNVVLAAHNDIYGELFRNLDQLEPGDEFYIQTSSEIITYRITGTEIVEPTDVHVMENQGRPVATLISCYPHGVNNKRIVVSAERVDA